VSKVVAGAGAAATSAVAGSLFGATGTVVGAALGSVVATVSTTLYQRSIDKTRETVLARVKVPRKDETADPLATVPLQRGPEGVVPAPTIVAPVEGAADARPWWRRKRVIVPVVSTVVAFLIAMVAITGIEWIKGSPLSGQGSGTSVGVVTGRSDESTQDSGTSGDRQQDGSSTETTTEAPSSGSGSEQATETPSPTTSGSAAPTTTSSAPTTTPAAQGGQRGGSAPTG
jgi:hypothetical protein